MTVHILTLCHLVKETEEIKGTKIMCFLFLFLIVFREIKMRGNFNFLLVGGT